MLDVQYGADLEPGNEDKPVDLIVGNLLDEILSRQEDIAEHQAHIENFPLGNEYEPDKENQFNGMERLRDISRNNYAKVIVDAVSSKCGIEGFRSSVETDEEGDSLIKRLFDRDDMGFAIQDAVDLACTYRKSYLLVDPVTGRQKVIPANNAAVMMDSNNEPVAAIVITRDRALKRDTLRVFLREVDPETGEAKGKLNSFIAIRALDEKPLLRETGLKITGHDEEVPLSGHIRRGWVWWKRQEGVKTDRVPVTVLKNKDNKNEFEDATDTIARINHTIWQRVIIVTMQAFRQRAITGNFPKVDAKGREIDYGEMFEPGPGSLWQLPEGAEMWESSQTDTTGLLAAVKDDEKALGAQTKTPMNHFSDSVNNSAEGAASQKEAYYDKIEDRRKRFGSRLRRHTSVLLEVNDEAERSSIDHLEVIWTPIESLSLTERTAAFASLKGNGLATRTALREGMKFTPSEIQLALEEITDDLLDQAVTSAISGDTPLAKSSRNANQGQAKAPGDTSESLNKAITEGRKANQA